VSAGVDLKSISAKFSLSVGFQFMTKSITTNNKVFVQSSARFQCLKTFFFVTFSTSKISWSICPQQAFLAWCDICIVQALPFLKRIGQHRAKCYGLNGSFDNDEEKHFIAIIKNEFLLFN